MTQRLARLAGLVIAGVAVAGAPAEDLFRGAADSRDLAPGHLVPQVPPGGPDSPYAAFLLELEGAATMLFLQDEQGVTWRIELLRLRSGRARKLYAVSLLPGKYWWKGFARHRPRSDGRIDVYEVLDVDPVPLEVRADRANYGGRIVSEVQPRRRTHAAEVGRGQVKVNPYDFSSRFAVEDDGPAALARLAGVWPWVARRRLPLASALLGPGGSSSPRRELPPPSPGGVGEGSSWGVRVR